jgi:type IV pilus assembly protein PilM
MKVIKKQAIGLDISERSIEIVEIIKTGQKYSLENYARTKLRAGIIEDGKIKNKERLRQEFIKLLSKTNLKIKKNDNFFINVPESKCFTHSFMIEKTGMMRGEIEKEIAKSIPIKNEDLIFEYQMISTEDGTSHVVAIATEKKVLIEMEKFFSSLGVKNIYFDSEILAIARGLNFNKKKITRCLVDIGTVKTNISFFNKSGLLFTYQSDTGGDTFNEAIAEATDIEKSSAEKEKKIDGLNSKDADMVKAIKKCVDNICTEIKRASIYVLDRFDEDVDEIVLAGGGSQMPGMKEYINKKFNIDTVHASGIYKQTKNAQLYIEAIGLAMRGLNKTWSKQPLFHLKDEKQTESKRKTIRQEIEIEGEEIIESKPENDIDKKKKSDAIRKQQKKVRKQITILAIIFIIGALSILGSFLYRKTQRDTRQTDLKEAELTQFTQTQSIDLSTIINVNLDNFTAGQVRGRIIEDKINTAVNEKNAMNISMAKMRKQLKEDEILWEKPMETIKQIDEIQIFPMTFKWMVYNEKELIENLTGIIDSKNTENTPYAFNKILVKDINPSATNGNYIVDSEITISVDKEINLD